MEKIIALIDKNYIFILFQIYLLIIELNLFILYKYYNI